MLYLMFVLYRFRTRHAGFELRLVSVGELRHDRGPLEYSIEWLTCAFASMCDVMLVSLPGAVEDRLRAYVPVGFQNGV